MPDDGGGGDRAHVADPPAGRQCDDDVADVHFVDVVTSLIAKRFSATSTCARRRFVERRARQIVSETQNVARHGVESAFRSPGVLEAVNSSISAFGFDSL